MSLVYGRTDQMAPGWVRVWLYGGSGSGKTVAAASFPNPHFLYPHNEDSVKTLRGLPFSYTQLVPEEGKVRSDLLGFADTLYSIAQRGGPAALHQKYGQTLVFEAYTHMSDLVVNELMQLSLSRNGGDKGKMDEPKWGLLRAFMLQLRDSFWRLPMHLVFTSLARMGVDGKGSIVQGGPMGQGAAVELIASSCDAIGLCEVTLDKQRVVEFSRANYIARTRFRGMPSGPYANTQLWQAFAPFLGY